MMILGSGSSASASRACVNVYAMQGCGVSMLYTQFVSLRNLQNALRNLARVRVRVKVMFRSEICKCRMCDF